MNFDGITLGHSESIKILGVHVDRHLCWDKQVSAVAQRCNGTVATIRKLNVPRETTKHLMESLMFPMIRYCLPVWAPKTQILRNRIEKVLNFAVRTVTGLKKYDHVSQARTELGWVTFEAMIKLRDVQRIYHMMWNDEGSERLKSLIERRSEVSLRSTRASNDETVLHTGRCRLQATMSSFPHRAVATWNSLPSSVIRCSAARFKKESQACPSV